MASAGATSAMQPDGAPAPPPVVGSMADDRSHRSGAVGCWEWMPGLPEREREVIKIFMYKLGQPVNGVSNTNPAQRGWSYFVPPWQLFITSSLYELYDCV